MIWPTVRAIAVAMIFHHLNIESMKNYEDTERNVHTGGRKAMVTTTSVVAETMIGQVIVK